MQTKARIAGSCLIAALAVLGVTPPAAAAPKRITGKLSKSHYTVIALADDGEARSVHVRRARFSLKPPAKRVTLHLRAPNGTYAGPVVLGRTKAGKRVIVGLRAGARLGKVKVRRGYAKPAKRLRNRLLVERRWARARKGVPIGARVFGRVRSRVSGIVPADRDLDAIPTPLDIDDDGDLVLDAVDRSPAQPRASQAESPFHVFSDMTLELERVVNHNAGSTDAAIEDALPAFGQVAVIILPGDTAELDCGRPQSRTDPTLGGLVYCSRGGTGRAKGQPFPGDPGGPFDADGDGFGSLTPEGPPAPGAGPVGGMGIQHHATSDQIGSGDLLIQRVTTDGVESEYMSTLGFVFATVPALKSFSDGQSPPRTVSYPVAAGTPANPGGPGTRSNPFPVAADPSTGEVVLTLTFWRPQRRPMRGEQGFSDPPTEWTDIGGLAYSASPADAGGNCPPAAFSKASPPDNNLKLATPDDAPSIFNNGRGGFIDLAVDRRANPANTFTYTLNVSRCLASEGISFEPGEAGGVDFQGIAPSFGGVAHHPVFFERQ